MYLAIFDYLNNQDCKDMVSLLQLQQLPFFLEDVPQVLGGLWELMLNFCAEHLGGQPLM